MKFCAKNEPRLRPFESYCENTTGPCEHERIKELPFFYYGHKNDTINSWNRFKVLKGLRIKIRTYVNITKLNGNDSFACI